MRIGLFTDTYLPDINGVVSSTVTLKKALEKQGHTVFVISNHAGTKIEMEDQVLRLPGITLKGLYGYKLSSPISMRAGTYIRNMNLDVIHLQTNFGVGIYGQTLAGMLGIPLVDTYHTMYEDYTHYINPFGLTGVEKVSRDAIRAASRKVCNSVQAVVSPSEKTKEILQEYGVMAPIYVVPTGLDLSAFMDAKNHTEKLKQIRSRVTDDPDACVLVFVGRLAKEKSLEFPIEAFARLKDPKFHLAIVGAGPDEDYYKDYTEKLNGFDNVHFLGKAAPDEVADYYAAFDGFVSASLSETQGMTYLEALATGRMVFGRRDDVLDGLIEEGVTGYYFDDADELTEKMHQFVLLSQEQRQNNAEKCLEKTSDYTDTMFAGKMIHVYEQAILDYSRTYTVDKIQITDDFATVTVSRDSQREPVKILIPLEEYFEQKISLDTKLDAYMVDAWLDKLPLYQGWRAVKKRVFSKDMTEAQILRYCKTNLELDADMAGALVSELKERNLIDDTAYALDKADYWQSQGSSRRRIAQKLARDGISQELIDKALATLPEELEERNAKAYAKRMVSSVRHQSDKIKRQTIIRKLIAQGYSSETARDAASALSFDEEDEAALETAYRKALRLYASAEPDKREQKIKNYCLKQGFAYEQIRRLMEREAADD